jgi:hypothetical protein
MARWLREKLGLTWHFGVVVGFFMVGAVLADAGAGLVIAYAFAACGIFLMWLYARSLR